MKSTAVARRRFLCATGTAALAFPFLESFARGADVTQNLTELWAGFAELDRTTPLDTEILKAWEQDGVVCRIVRYQVGIFKGAPSRVAAFYAFPNGGTKLPAILEMHGGGQSASLNSVVTYAKRGYASLSINWGGNKMSLGQETWSGLQTDWGKLDATHPPQLVLNLKIPDGVPLLTLTPDESQPVRWVDIYYSLDPHGLTRFWRDAKAMKAGQQWTAACPILRLDQPLFAFANVIYDIPEQYRKAKPAAGLDNTATFAISSRVLSAAPAQLQASGVKATDRPERRIDDGGRGWHDWYRLNWGHPPLWTATTRKLKDPKWRGPDGAKLVFEIKTQTDNALVLTFNCNGWGAFTPGKPAMDYTAVKELKGSPDWQTVSVSLNELAATDPKITASLASWQTVTEFSLSPRGETVKDGQKVEVPGKSWQGPREIRNLRWEGGEA